MTKISFSEGLEVHYKDMFGIVNFIGKTYVTICIKSFEDKVRNVCLVVPPTEYNLIQLAKESHK